MTAPPPIFLVGFMGSGKSEVGRRVSALLGARFVDLDREIEAEAGASVAEQFARDGEATFRARESRALECACDAATTAAEGLVVATGGGLYADPAHRARIEQASGIAVWLDAPLAVLERRVARDGSRPRWGTPEEVSRLFAVRAAAYANAPLRVAAEDEPDAVATRVIEALRQRGGFAWKSSRS
jgi:shikimate kinase